MSTTFTIGTGETSFTFSVDQAGWIRAGARPDGSVPVIGGQSDLRGAIAAPTQWGEVEEATGNNAVISDGVSLYPAAHFEDALLEGQVQDILWALDGTAAAGGRLLEVGCGPGYLLAKLAEHLQDWTVEGLDPSPDSVGQARAAGHTVHFGTLDTVDLAGPYDAVVVMGNFQLHHDPAGTLRRLAAISRTGARMFLDSKNPSSSARLVARTLLGLPVTRRLDICHGMAAHAFHGMRHGIPQQAFADLLEAAGWEQQQLRTTGPRLLRFGNEHRLAHGTAGVTWKLMDGVDTVRSERAWIQIAAQRR